ncbi:MAG TPA: hypothetical protein GXZ58_10515 [Bacilli bacterium]|nr:hypothetical protein [Bacilli bacterium]
MSEYIDDVTQHLAQDDFQQYWPGFELVAYALYDENFVYLFNHPKMIKEPNKKYQILRRDDQFNGCTLILHHDYPTAIVDLELYNDDASLYSILVHELFHGFQYLKDESRFANEMMGVTYPLLKENIELRNQERISLYRAVFENNNEKKQQFLTTFIALREKRTSIINDHLQYENLIETIEGPAWYVELKSYSEKSDQSYDSILANYGQQLMDKYESSSNIRRSCYSSGLFICLLLDQLVPDWKEDFWGREETIYQLLKQNFNEIVQINAVKISPETEKVLERTLQKRKSMIINFEQQAGFHLIIEGKITAKGFDPMNILLFEDRLLHKNFLKIDINNQDYLVQQPVIAYCKDGLRNISKLHLVLRNKPFENGESITIDGIGIIKGKYEVKNGRLHLYVS